jgi:ribonuclease HI
MIITLFADASFDATRKIGTWAAWAKCDGATMRAGGVFKTPIDNSTTAELGAIANGLHLAIAEFDPSAGALVVIESDNITALALASGDTQIVKPKTVRRMGRQIHAMRDSIAAIVGARRLRVRTKHVRGHRGVGDPRSAVNTWCDRMCHQHLTSARRRNEREKAHDA